DPGGRYQSAEEFQEGLTRVATRHRLLVGASEMSAHLKTIAGDDASMWLKLETFGHERGEPTQAHGTAVLSTQGIVDGEDEHSRPAFDLSDADEEDEEEEDSDVVDVLRARNRPPSLPTGELTSVIAVRKKQGGGVNDLLATMREDEPQLRESQPRRSEPMVAPQPSSAPRRIALPKLNEFGNDESRKQTVVRETGSPRNKLPSGGHASPAAPARSLGASKQTSSPPLGDATKVHAPSQAGFARQHDPVGAMPNPLGGAPLSAASGHSGTPGAATRRLPTSGIRPRPRGERFEGTAHIRRPRRLIGIMIVLLLIGIGVALGVAFSGPELDVVDPSVSPALGPSGGAATGTAGTAGTAGAPAAAPEATPATGTTVAPGGTATGSGAARQQRPPSELPGPPPATSGTP
ncbi:MAG: hypothetical protein ACXVDD_20860, partial [Polyangia bacterium]